MLSRRLLCAAIILLLGGRPVGRPPDIAAAAAELVQLRASFNGTDRLNGANPPDLSLAAGPSSLVLFTNDGLTIRSKTGTLIASAELNQFFNPVRPLDRERLIDTNAHFDPVSQRFFVVASGAFRDGGASCAQPGTCWSHLFLAVSRSAAPVTSGVADWYFYAFDATVEAGVLTANFTDHANVGTGGPFTYITSTQATFLDESGQHVMIRVLPTERLIRGEPVTYVDFVGMTNAEGRFEQQFAPVRVFAATDSAMLLNDAGNCAIGVWTIGGTATNPSLTRRTARSSATGFDGCRQVQQDAPQPDGALPLALSSRQTLRSPAIRRGGSIWAVEQMQRSVVGTPRAAIRWMQLSILDPESPQFVQEGLVEDVSLPSFFPALAADHAGNAGLVFGRSGPSLYPSTYYAGRLASDPPGTMRAPKLLKGGTTSLRIPPYPGGVANFYGDYFGVSADPQDDSIWLLGQYVKSATVWGSWIGNLAFDPLSAAPAPVYLSASTDGTRLSPAAVVSVASASGPTSDWTIADVPSHLEVSRLDSGSFAVRARAQRYDPGLTTASLTLRSPSGARTGTTVAVHVNGLAATAPPVGAFDTPADGAALQGSVAVTGWALDDLEVAAVQIWRDPHPSDPPAAVFSGPAPQGGKVFVGQAAFVEGARPDVEAASTMPLNARAGWGYLMLTRGMPWDGAGAFRLYGIALDREGHAVEIGRKSVSVVNATAAKPFGAIDTPAQGATISGLYPVTGWVLTPNPGATIPAANVRVAIDGVLLPEALSMSDRADITAGFPGFNTSGAGRGLFIDTTQLANGLHTVGWLVTDSTGQSDGVGSRFFWVQNGLKNLPAVAVGAR